MKLILLTFTLITFGISSTLLADTIQLTNGSIVKGRILYQDAENMTFKTESGQISTIPKKSISKIIQVDKKKDQGSEDSSVSETETDLSSPNNKRGNSEGNQTVKIIERIIERPTVTNNTVTTTTTTDSGLAGRVQKLESTTEAHSKLIERDYELRKEELQIRKKEMDRMEKLLEREERLQKEEFEYLKKEKRLRELEKEKEEEQKKVTEKRLAELEIRNKRLERYLEMDETMVDYYASPRSPWELVYRSALFPGWGQRHAKQDFMGNTFGISIFSLLFLGGFIEYQAKQAKIAIEDKLVTEVVINPLTINSLFSSSSLLSTYQANQAIKKINAANDALELADTQITLARRMTQLAIAIYLAQIIHAYIIGVEWAKVKPRDYSEKGLKAGISFDVIPDTNGLRGTTNGGGTRSEIRYSFSF